MVTVAEPSGLLPPEQTDEGFTSEAVRSGTSRLSSITNCSSAETQDLSSVTLTK